MKAKEKLVKDKEALAYRLEEASKSGTMYTIPMESSSVDQSPNRASNSLGLDSNDYTEPGARPAKSASLGVTSQSPSLK